MADKFKTGDLVEYFETMYSKVHKVHRGIVVKKKYSGVHSFETGAYSNIYMVLTTENKTNWVMEDDLIKLEDLVRNEKQ